MVSEHYVMVGQAKIALIFKIEFGFLGWCHTTNKCQNQDLKSDLWKEISLNPLALYTFPSDTIGFLNFSSCILKEKKKKEDCSELE